MSPELPAAPDFDHLRKQAKRLLRAARAAEAPALARLRALPHLAALPDEKLAETAHLADAQLAIAREHGAASWSALKRAVEDALPPEAQAARFLEALREGDAARAGRLFARHPEIARSSFEGACCAGDAEFVASELARDPRLAVSRATDPEWTPLVYLSASPLHAESAERSAGIRRCAELLLDHGADANESTPWEGGGVESRLTALYRACVANNVPVVRLLLERGANPDDGESVYHAAELAHFACLELLLANGAEISARQAPWGNTPLYFLVGYQESNLAARAADRGMRWLLEHGADPNVTVEPSGETALHRVAAGGRSRALAELLLDHGANPNLARGDGRTPWLLALRTGNTEVAEALRARGASETGATPMDRLLGACMRGDEPAARALLAEKPGLMASLTDEDRRVAAQAVHDGRLGSLRLMVALGFDLGWGAESGGTPLHHAAWFGKVEMARLLLELGAPVNVRERTYGSSPLAWAAHGSTNCRKADDDYRAIVEMLLAAGADRETSINFWNEPPERFASPRVAQLLREKGFAPAAEGAR